MKKFNAEAQRRRGENDLAKDAIPSLSTQRREGGKDELQSPIPNLQREARNLPISQSPYTTTSSRIAYENPWFRIRTDGIVFPNGQAGEYNVLEHPGAVFIVPLTAAGEIVLIRQYRYTLDEWCWEIPAGSLQDGKSIEETAVSELREEIGGTSDPLIEIATFNAANGMLHALNYAFLATNVELGETQHEASEVMTIHKVPAHEVFAMVRAGQMVDGISALSILLAEKEIIRRLGD